MEVSSIELEAQQFDFAQLKKDLFLKKNSKASRTQSPRPLPSSGAHYNNKRDDWKAIVWFGRAKCSRTTVQC